MDNNQITKILTMALIFMAVILVILIIVYIILKIKSNKKEKRENGKLDENGKEIKSKEISKEESKKSVLDFMNFYSIQNDMIVQKKGRRFLMVLQCQGINYDLMSEMEKNSVEEGFIQFLNTLTHPIQLYIQTRKVNLTSSIEAYKRKLRETEDNLNRVKYQYERMKKNESADSKQLNKLLFEVTKQTNLYEYTKDVIRNTEMMSLNKNILNKQYYIIISYSPEGDEGALLRRRRSGRYGFLRVIYKSTIVE